MTTRAATATLRCFRVMASEAEVLVVGAEPPLADRAVDRLAELEQRWSRFLEHSDITILNRAQGRAVSVDPSTILAVEAIVEAWHRTGGRFDPTVLPALVAHGYRHSVGVGGALAPAVPGRVIGAPDGIVIDRRAGTITLPPEVAIDLGGIGKGMAADLVVAELLAAGAAGALVNVGGDLRVAGEPPPGADAWYVAVADPRRPGTPLATLGLLDGGIATSGTDVRRWFGADGAPRHHLIDPATGAPATTNVSTATVVAGDAATAEAFATAVVVAGVGEGFRLLDRAGLAGLAVTTDGRVHRSTEVFER